VTLLLALALQASEARDLIERMQSEDPAVREAATRKLAELGKEAEPELRKAANHPDVEVAGRVRTLLRNLAIADSMTPRLRSAMPGIVGRLQSGDDRQWTRVFLELRYASSLRRPDFETLAAPALRAAQSEEERAQVLETLRAKRLRSASAEVTALLGDPNLSWRAFAALTAAQGRDAIPLFLKLLKGDSDRSRLPALASLVELKAIEALPQIRKMLEEDHPELRRRAARAYAELAGRDALPDLRKMAEDADPAVSSAGIEGLAATGLKEAGPWVLEALKSPDPDVRSAAADAAGELGLKEALAPIISMLKDKDEDLKYDALHALERYGNRAAARAIVPLLSDKDEDVRDEAFRILGGMGIREGTAEIAKLLDSDTSEVRRGAMELLAVMGAKETFDQVARGLKDGSESIRFTSIYALGAIDPPRAVRELAPLLAKDESWKGVQDWLTDVRPREAVAELTKMLESETSEDVRARIKETLADAFDAPTPGAVELLEDKDPKVRATVLNGLRSAGATPLAVKRLKDADPEVRYAAVAALERFGSKEILGALADEDLEVLCAAIRGAGALQLSEAAPDLIKLLKSPHPLVRAESAETLGRLGVEEATPALLELARSPHPYVRASAALGFWGLKNPEARAALDGLRKDPHPYVRRMAAQTAETEPSPHARAAAVRTLRSLPELADMLEDPNPLVLEAAALKLVEMGTKESVCAAARAVDLSLLSIKTKARPDVVAGILDLLKDPDDDIRARAVGALSALGAKEAAPKLLELLGGRISEAVLQALGELSVREAVPKIMTFLDHHDWILRRAAVEALATLKAKEAGPRLIELLDDPARDVRHAAALALGGLGCKDAQPKLLDMLADENVHAAAALCLLGRREGIPVIVSDAEDLIRLRGGFFELLDELPERPSFLFALNALRTPDIRHRLEGKAVESPVGGALHDVAKRIAGEAEMAFEARIPGVGPGEWDLLRRRRGDLWSALFSAATSIQRSPPGPAEGEVILEDGRVRFIDFEDAVRFWRTWAEK